MLMQTSAQLHLYTDVSGQELKLLPSEFSLHYTRLQGKRQGKETC